MKPKIFFLLLLSLYIVNCTLYISHATIRYVSKTGSSTPPYTSWETAADSIQKAVNIAEVGDTIYVANGVYYEAVYVDKTINIWGSSMDSTIINGTNISGFDIVYFFENNSTFKYFTITSSVQLKTGINSRESNLVAEYCRIFNLARPLGINSSSVHISNFIINAFDRGIRDECFPDTCRSVYTNNVIISRYYSGETPVLFPFGGYPEFSNNILIEETPNNWRGIYAQTSGTVIKNNLIAGFSHYGITLYPLGSTVIDSVYNNMITDMTLYSIEAAPGNTTRISNNIFQRNSSALISYSSPARLDYNLFWQVQSLVTNQPFIGDSNIIADPMFAKDTIPSSEMNFDFHLQKYSPAIDKGNPNILDVDGSRSDIGIFGGPLGQKYTYMDLAPKPPRNLTASLDSGLVHLKWNKNTEADLFHYRVYRDTVPDFIYDTTKIIATVADTFYYDDVPDRINSGNYYYKLTAIDTAVNQSAVSEEVHITITGIPEAPPVVVEHYRLLQNYPNPFNPTTTIPYRLKEGGYVKVMVCDIKGELVRVLVNQYQSAGYYEVEFSPNKTERKKAEGYVEFETGYYGNVASGIYLYRIEVIGEEQIPVYSDMKKMILLK